MLFARHSEFQSKLYMQIYEKKTILKTFGLTSSINASKIISFEQTFLIYPEGLIEVRNN